MSKHIILGVTSKQIILGRQPIAKKTLRK